jgi:hypothetical protein
MVCSVFEAVLIGLDIYSGLPLVGGLLDILFNLIANFAAGFIGCF